MYLVLDVNKLDVERTAAELPLEVAEATICPTVEDALDERRVILENDPKANVRYFKMVRVYPTLAARGELE